MRYPVQLLIFICLATLIYVALGCFIPFFWTSEYDVIVVHGLAIFVTLGCFASFSWTVESDAIAMHELVSSFMLR